MMTIKTPILPIKQTFVKKPNTPHELNLQAICIFMATGFFMGEDTYYKDEVCLLPGHNHLIDEKGYLIKSEPWFKWTYAPRNISFNEALDEYINLLTKITKEQIGNNAVILPLSGGLDSRSQALVLKNLENPVHSFSYSFRNGYPEHQISKKIAEACNFTFESFQIPDGYLWGCVKDLAEINGCYSEFTHPRQMAVLHNLKGMNGVFSLGHWGDVLFDRGVPKDTSDSELIPFIFKKMIKPKGLELARKLWNVWGLEGDFDTYLRDRIEVDLANIKIDDLSAKVRAYKTSQWAHRWTTTNLTVFEAAQPITLPYYDNRMCEFICSIPEAYLADRKLQIAHLKRDNSIAKVTWHAQSPFNLTNFEYNKFPYNLPYRVLNKLKREVLSVVGKSSIQRNWELQFLGEDNAKQLESYLFDSNFNLWIPNSIIKDVYYDFQHGDAVANSHSISMLLTLSLWHQQNFNSI
ncbi:asparagine synthase-related protein [Gelidibacter sp. F2691]|nr:asparagine synthase-related protein [Gelidibacter sp. F2691]